MPNASYAKGAAFERRVQSDLEDRGWFVMRAPASKGGFDLIGITATGRPYFIECKVNKNALGPAGRIALYDLAATYCASAMLVSRGPKPRCPIQFWRIAADGALVFLGEADVERS